MPEQQAALFDTVPQPLRRALWQFYAEGMSGEGDTEGVCSLAGADHDLLSEAFHIIGELSPFKTFPATVVSLEPGAAEGWEVGEEFEARVCDLRWFVEWEEEAGR